MMGFLDQTSNSGQKSWSGLFSMMSRFLSDTFSFPLPALPSVQYRFHWQVRCPRRFLCKICHNQTARWKVGRSICGPAVSRGAGPVQVGVSVRIYINCMNRRDNSICMEITSLGIIYHPWIVVKISQPKKSCLTIKHIKVILLLCLAQFNLIYYQ